MSESLPTPHCDCGWSGHKRHAYWCRSRSASPETPPTSSIEPRTETGLAPCPFCGGSAREEAKEGVIHCTQCCAEISAFFTPIEQTRRAWNKRATPNAGSVSEEKPASVEPLGEWRIEKRTYCSRIIFGREDNWLDMKLSRLELLQVIVDEHNASVASLQEEVEQLRKSLEVFKTNWPKTHKAIRSDIQLGEAAEEIHALSELCAALKGDKQP